MATPPRNDSKEDPSPEKSQTQTPPSLSLSLSLLPLPSPSSKHNPHVPFASSSSSSRSPAADNFFSHPSMKPPQLPTPIVLPPGFMFVPSDEILIFHYLRPFLHHNKKSSPNVPIHRVNIYDSNPEQLSKEHEKGNDKEWFFITERTKLREGGKHKSRSDNGGGLWRATIAPKKIEAEQGVVGYKNGLEYYANGVKSDWLMNEYWIESSSHDDNKKVDHALCKMYLTPAAYKRKAEEEEREKKKRMKKDEEEVDPINSHHKIPDEFKFF